MALNNDFIQLVSEMRAAQKQYFKDRTRSALQQSKDLEKKVDAWLEKNVSTVNQASLF
jgi:hypothetical protein